MIKQSSFVLALFLGNASAIRFATGMNGDEDLGEDITMKGDKFHYVQGAPANQTNVQTEAEPEKVHTLDPKINRQHTTFYA
jgi:hypothetical protein